MRQLNKLERKEFRDLLKKQERSCLTLTESNKLKFYVIKDQSTNKGLK